MTKILFLCDMLVQKSLTIGQILIKIRLSKENFVRQIFSDKVPNILDLFREAYDLSALNNALIIKSLLK